MYTNAPDGLGSARTELVRHGNRLLADGLSIGSAGNLSVRVGDVVAITPSGIAYPLMRAADICLVTLKGEQLAITALGGPVRVAPYARFGSTQLAEAAVAALDGRSAVILRNHGAVTYGADLAQAYDRALLLEWLACTYRLGLAYGEPAVLSAAELDEVAAESRRRRYGTRTAPRS
jgi:L-fuculose-phosphate aldolase